MWSRQFLSGQALVVRLRIRVDEKIEPPRVTVEFRDANGSLLGVNESEADTLGWDGEPGETELVFTCPRLPLADGPTLLAYKGEREMAAKAIEAVRAL